MNHSQLNSLHTTAGAQLGEFEGWEIPLVYSSIKAELDATQTGAGLVDLSHLGTVILEGPDARRFANGMFTNNIRQLNEGQCNRSAMCDDRGRIQGLIDLYCTADDKFEGVLEGVTAEWFESRYEMYIVFDDVQMTVSQQAPWILSIQGPQAASVLETAGFPVPPAGEHALASDGILVGAKDRSGLGGFDLWVTTEAIENVWAKLLRSGAVGIGHLALEALRIRHGRARWPVDGTEKSMVHELGLNEEVCNFNKGCYLGQEVINRVDVKGQITKRLHRVAIDSPAAQAIGGTVMLDDTAVGVVKSATNTDDGCMGLAVLRRAAWQPNTAVTIVLDDAEHPGTVQAQS